MKSSAIALISAAALLALAACGKENPAPTTPGGDMREVQQGTISDNMIMLDQVASDGTAIDNSIPVDTSLKAAPKAEPVSDSASTDAASSASEAAPAAASTAPAATPAPPPAPATK